MLTFALRSLIDSSIFVVCSCRLTYWVLLPSVAQEVPIMVREKWRTGGLTGSSPPGGKKGQNC